MIETLKAYAAAHYEDGGHWIAETYGAADYRAALAQAGNDLEKAKAALKKKWCLLNARQADAGDY